MAARMAARGVPRLAGDDPAGMGQARISRRSTIRRATYYSAPKQKDGPKSLDEVDPELLAHLREARHPAARARGAGWRTNGGVAVDAVFDSVSVATTFKAQLAELGIIFCSFGEAVREHPELVRKYLGTVVPQNDNFFAALNSAVFSDGSFAYIPPGVRCPMELSHLFPHQCAQQRPVRAHPADRRQGRLCQLSRRLHRAAARREPAARRGRRADRARGRADQILDGAELVSRRRRGQGRHLQFRHQARRLPRRPGEDLVDAGRDRLGDHLEIPELHPRRRQFGRRILFGRDHQQPPAGRYRHQDDPYRAQHVARRSSRRASRPGAARTPIAVWCGCSRRAEGARNYTQCDSLLIGDRCGAHTVPYIEVRNPSARVEHEATTSKISEDQLFYCRQRGLVGRGRAVADRQRLLQGSPEGTADGVRGRGAEAARRQPRRQRRVRR